MQCCLHEYLQLYIRLTSTKFKRKAPLCRTQFLKSDVFLWRRLRLSTFQAKIHIPLLALLVLLINL